MGFSLWMTSRGPGEVTQTDKPLASKLQFIIQEPTPLPAEVGLSSADQKEVETPWLGERGREMPENLVENPTL